MGVSRFERQTPMEKLLRGAVVVCAGCYSEDVTWTDEDGVGWCQLHEEKGKKEWAKVSRIRKRLTKVAKGQQEIGT